jgi:hypothetical protein
MRQVSHVLNYAHGRSSLKWGQTLQTRTDIVSVKGFIESLAAFQSKEKELRFICRCLCISCSPTGIQTGILESILTVLRSTPGVTVHQKGKSARCYDNACSWRNPPFVEVQVRQVQPRMKAAVDEAVDEMDFSISIPRRPLIMRDLRAFWHVTRIFAGLKHACERVAVEP